MSVDEIKQRVAELAWYHSIDLGHGIVTPGLGVMDQLTDDELPSFAGKSVLDIGAWDGLYSFRAEGSGASRVVALDHYAWGVNFARRQDYWDECARAGTVPDPDRDVRDFWEDSLPGRQGFELAHQVLGSSVEPVLADFMTADLEALGVFDVVLYLGVLYHMVEPLTALRRLRRVTGEVAVIETLAVRVLGQSEASLLAFEPGDEWNADFGNWFAPTERALINLCRAAGFGRVEVVRGPPQVPAWRDRIRRNSASENFTYRATVRAYT